MKKIIPHCLKPNSLNLALLEEDPDFRSDFLFFIRLAGTYAQTIFWQAFPRSALARRKKMFEIAKKVIPENKKHFRAAILDPQKRYAKTTDLFHGGFIKLLEEIGKDDSIKKKFTNGLKQEHGIFWRFDEFISFLKILMEKRHYLEHFEERTHSGKTFSQASNIKVIEALGILLLPEIANILEMSTKSVKGKEAKDAADTLHTVLAWCKQERSKSIRLMFSEERERSRLDKRRRKALSPENNTQVWLKSYRSLGISPTDYKQFQFKRRYDFIGRQNLRLLFAELGVPLKKKSHTLVYASDTSKKLSFRYDVEPFYLLSVRAGATIHHFIDFAPKNKKGKLCDPVLKDIRDTLAHNGLFWNIQTHDNQNNNRRLTVEEVFGIIMEQLTLSQRSMFCDKIESLLRHENYAVVHDQVDGHPRTKKIRRWSADKRKQIKKSIDGDTEVSSRRRIRKIAATWMRALQSAGQARGLQSAGKNAT